MNLQTESRTILCRDFPSLPVKFLDSGTHIHSARLIKLHRSQSMEEERLCLG
jgi:hypothetical protein